MYIFSRKIRFFKFNLVIQAMIRVKPNHLSLLVCELFNRFCQESFIIFTPFWAIDNFIRIIIWSMFHLIIQLFCRKKISKKLFLNLRSKNVASITNFVLLLKKSKTVFISGIFSENFESSYWKVSKFVMF